MVKGVQKAWSTTALDNGTADDNIAVAEGSGFKMPAINDAIRGVMAGVKGYANQVDGAKTSGGSGNAYTFTSDSNSAISTAYAQGMRLTFKANHTCSGASTLNADGVGAVAIRKGGAEAALAANDIVANGVYTVVHNGTYWILQNPETGIASYQAADAMLTALAALSWVSGNPLIQVTAADTVSLTLTPSVTDLTLSGVLKLANGAATAGQQSIFWANDTDNGFYLKGSNNPAAIAGNVEVFNWSSSRIAFGLRAYFPNGTVSAPGITWASDSSQDTGWYRIGEDNIGMAIAGSKAADYAAALIAFTPPVQARIPRSSETSGTLTVASANKVVTCSGGVTLPASVFTADDVVGLDGNGTNRTITRGSGLTMYLNGSNVATATLAANGVGYAYYRSATVCILSGAFS